MYQIAYYMEDGKVKYLSQDMKGLTWKNPGAWKSEGKAKNVIAHLKNQKNFKTIADKLVVELKDDKKRTVPEPQKLVLTQEQTQQVIENKAPTVVANSGFRRKPIPKAIADGIDVIKAIRDFNTVQGSGHELQEYFENVVKHEEEKTMDILHLLEFNDFDAADGWAYAKMLQGCRRRRRDAKDRLVAMRTLKEEQPEVDLSTTMQQLSRSDTRKYTPRAIPEIFTGKMKAFKNYHQA